MDGEKDLAELRQKYYGLFVNLLWKEPEVEFLKSLLDGISERIRGADGLSNLMCEGWKKIQTYLEENLADDVEFEFVELFLGPQKPEIQPYESYYFAGSVFQAPLASVRSFMKDIGLVKNEGELPEPEDTLGFELEIMNWMIIKQKKTEDLEEEKIWLDYQESFLKEHLLVWGPTCCDDIASASKSNFYEGVGLLLKGFLEIEKELFKNRSSKKIDSLDEVRKLYGNIKDWKGPLFEANVNNKSKE